MQRLACGFERTHEHCALLGSQATADDCHTVCVLIHLQRTALVAVSVLTRFGDLVDPAPAAHDTLDLTRAAGFADREQSLFRSIPTRHALAASRWAESSAICWPSCSVSAIVSGVG
jgi:hypothetical protein